MWNRNTRMAAILALTVSMCSLAHHLTAGERPPKTNDDYLSIRESLLPMFSPAFRMNEWFPIHRVNPDVRPYILFYLEHDNSNYEYVAGGLWLLGVVGTADDVDFVDKYLQSRLSSSGKDGSEFGRNVDVVGGAAGCFAGMMLRRDMQHAGEFIRRYADASAWRSSTALSDAEAGRGYNYFVLGAYEYSKADFILPLLRQASSGPRPFLRKSVIDALANRQQSKYVEMMKPGAKPEDTLKKYRMDFLDSHGEWIDILLRKETLAQWREAQERQKTAPTAEEKPTDSFESVDMSETIEGAYLRGVARDAAEALQKVSRMFIDSGAKNLPIREDILRAIHKAGLNNYSGFQVKVDMEARINDFVPDIKSGDRENDEGAAGPVVVRNGEAATVTFSIQGATESEDVTIRMERANNKWYWSPSVDPSVDAAAKIVEDRYLIESVRAAMLAYAQISEMLTNGNYDPLTIPVVDDGKLIPLEKRRRDKVKITEVLELEKRILEELTNAKLNSYGDHRITVRFEGTLGPGQTGAETDVMSLPVKGYETADVRFSIRNGAEAYRKHAPERSGEGCFDGAGGLRVFMKRINGKWYWNPFGW